MTSLTLHVGLPKGGDNVAIAMRAVPGAHRLAPGSSPVAIYRIPLTMAAVTALMAAAPRLGLQVGAEAQAAMEEVFRLHLRVKAFLDDPAPPEWPHPLRRKPMVHQLQAARAILAMGSRAMLSDDMGLGKSMVALMVAQTRRIIVICPASVKFNWRHEIEATLPIDRCTIIDGTPAQRAQQFDTWDQDSPLVINYDLLTFLAAPQWKVLLTAMNGAFLILDEAHYVKDRKAKRTQLVQQLVANDLSGLVALTGTPIRNTVEDVYSQVTLIRPNMWTGFWEFQSRHCQLAEMRVNGRRVHRTVGAKNMPLLNRMMNEVQIRRLKGDLLNLPPKIRTVHELALGDDERRVYKAMKEFWLYEFGALPKDTPVFSPQAKSALESALRLEQIAQGFLGGVPEPLWKAVQEGKWTKIEDEPGCLWCETTTKGAWLAETVEEILLQGRKVVVWFRFNPPMSRLRRLVGQHRCYVLRGNLSTVEKAGAIEGFQRDERPCAFFGQVQMAEGFNLTTANDVIFYGRNWSPAVNVQAEDRCHRIGQKGTVSIHIPIVRGTIESHIHTRLESKSDDAAAVLQRLTLEDLAKWMQEE